MLARDCKATCQTGAQQFQIAVLCSQLGFEHTTASRGAFLIRLSAIFTPIVASISGAQSCDGLQAWRAVRREHLAIQGSTATQATRCRASCGLDA